MSCSQTRRALLSAKATQHLRKPDHKDSLCRPLPNMPAAQEKELVDEKDVETVEEHDDLRTSKGGCFSVLDSHTGPKACSKLRSLFGG